MFKGLLPIGTVVLLKNSEKRVMIIGVMQKQKREDGGEVIWDYSGCLYPEGYLAPDRLYLFNNENISRIYNIGYQDSEQFEFKERVDKLRDEILERLRKKNEQNDEQQV
ncbi:MAG: DUF4176 domain-containing protein [Oscillospiraceae bacterium]|nr:DUF4176 domain-containing protein [Oscillospiraceae bacterium]